MVTKDKLILFPCGGNAIEALDCIDFSRYDVIGFIDDDLKKIGTKVFGLEVFDRTLLEKEPEALVLAVPGNPNNFKEREEIIDGLVDKNRLTSIIHPNASVSGFSKIGKNCLIMEGVVLKINSIVEDNVCILPNTVLHHDSVIKKNSLIGSNVVIAGHSKIGNTCYIGSGTRIINNITIGSDCLIGMGSNVIKSVESGKVVAGNPARIIG